MKKIEAVIPVSRLERTFASLKEISLGGITYYESKGRGEIPRPKVHSGRGTSTFTPEFNKNATIVIVANEDQVDKIVEKILEGASSGVKGEGKIFISDIDEMVDIGSRKRGDVAT
jgi:nitrogen regulatory protein P-II 1